VAISGSSIATDNKTVSVTLVVTGAPIISVNNTTVQLAGYPGGPPQYSYATFGNLASGTTLNIMNASGSAAFLTASAASSNTVLITATPGSLAAGTYSGVVTITSNAANNAQVAIPVEFTVTPAGLPLISAGGIVNSATYAPEAVSQGDVVSIFGSQFAPVGTYAVNAATPLATMLANTQVLVNNVPAPLYYVGPGQINFQLPYGAGPLSTVQVVANGNAGNIRSLSVTASAPRMLSGFVAGYGAIVNGLDGSLTFPTGTAVPGYATHPAKPGDTIVIYGIGFGQTTPGAMEGQAAPSVAPLESISKVTVTFGGGFSGNAVVAAASFAGLTPTAVGLYQVNVVVPATTPLGSVPLSLEVNGVPAVVCSTTSVCQPQSVNVAISATGK
jgi:uncharacterized protein (TIGR03437 family)